jgi:hypothetical protein
MPLGRIERPHSGGLLAVLLLLAVILASPPATSAFTQAPDRRPRPDRTPPTAPVVDGQSETEDTSPMFTFSSRDRRTPAAKIRFECSMDDAALHRCSREYSESLAFGKHVLRVRALDRAGNRSRITSFEFVVVGVWDAASDMLVAPNQANPNPDQYGNATWSYMWSSARVHDPARYRLFTHYTVVDANREQWDSGDLQSTPFPPRPLVGLDRPGGRIIMHPYPDEFAVLGWKSPVSGTVDFEGSVRSTDPCSRGVDWTLDQGRTTTMHGTLGGGQGQAFNGSVAITSGDSLYFVLDPGPDDICDTTVVELNIRTSVS